jgi:hypothetical protein
MLYPLNLYIMKRIFFLSLILIGSYSNAQNAFFTRKNEVSLKYGWWGSPTGGVNGFGVFGFEGRRNINKRFSLKADINAIYRGVYAYGIPKQDVKYNVGGNGQFVTDRDKGLFQNEPYVTYGFNFWINAGIQYHFLNAKRHDFSIGSDLTYSFFNYQNGYRGITLVDKNGAYVGIYRQYIVSGGSTLGFSGNLNYNFKPTERLVIGGTFNVMHLWDATTLTGVEPSFNVYVPITFKVGILFD